MHERANGSRRGEELQALLRLQVIQISSVSALLLLEQLRLQVIQICHCGQSVQILRRHSPHLSARGWRCSPHQQQHSPHQQPLSPAHRIHTHHPALRLTVTTASIPILQESLIFMVKISSRCPHACFNVLLDPLFNVLKWKKRSSWWSTRLSSLLGTCHFALLSFRTDYELSFIRN